MPTPWFDYVRFFGQLLLGLRNRHEAMIAAWRVPDLSPHLDGNVTPLVLDLANGRLHPQTMLLDAAGHQVYGIDWANQLTPGWTDRLYRLARWLYARRVYRPGQRQRYRLACGDVSRLPYADECFDLVTSVAAFEHFMDVPAVVADVARVLKPGGLAWVLVHPFTAPSGGHNVKLMEIPLRTLPKNVEAWDHLRQRRLPFHVPLNEWRIQQYVDEFSRHFEILKHECVLREGEHFLTPSLAAELSVYTPAELTCLAYVIVARKKANPS
jgi:SAM-dependent methyltransferase